MSVAHDINGLTNEMRAAQALKDALSKLPGMDEETIRDMIEGETGLREQIEYAFHFLTETEVLAGGLALKIEQFQDRATRYKDRLAFLRAAIEQAMVIAEVKTLELPDATITLASRGRSVVVTDEAKVPARFWKPKDPELDKTALKKALENKETIEGAELSNGSVSITVRRS